MSDSEQCSNQLQLDLILKEEEQCLNRLQFDVITHLVNFSYAFGQIITRYDFLEADV